MRERQSKSLKPYVDAHVAVGHEGLDVLEAADGAEAKDLEGFRKDLEAVKLPPEHEHLSQYRPYSVYRTERPIVAKSDPLWATRVPPLLPESDRVTPLPHDPMWASGPLPQYAVSSSFW